MLKKSKSILSTLIKTNLTEISLTKADHLLLSLATLLIAKKEKNSTNTILKKRKRKTNRTKRFILKKPSVLTLMLANSKKENIKNCSLNLIKLSKNSRDLKEIMLKCGENIKSCSKIAKKEVSRLKLSTG
jgi:hypothetical protein